VLQSSSRPLLLGAGTAFFAILFAAIPAGAQRIGSTVPATDADGSLAIESRAKLTENFPAASGFSASTYLHGFTFVRPAEPSSLLAKPLQTASLGTIAKMESAFYCNDTPFVDQVQLPVASLWRGRVKLIGLESDVTTANFVLGLPGSGTLHSLSMMGSGHLATRTPPSDQLVGMHMNFYFHGGEVGAQDNSGLHGVQYLVRASRDFLQTIVTR
jgi:hypothetical protein